jgi:hypothetical protein
MLIYRVLSAIAAAAFGAAVVMALPGFSPAVEAGPAPAISAPATPAPMVKADRLERPLASECTQQTWPYLDANCLRDRTPTAGQARVVRLVTLDRLPK